MRKEEAKTASTQADSRRLGYVGKKPGDRKSNDWYTPDKYLDSVRSVFGYIDLDPFSSNAANESVKAQRFFVEEDDAFVQDWTSNTVFMNPPYSAGLVALATGKFMDEYANGSFGCGIFLVNNSTETRWFQRALGEAKAVCFTNHRISFWTADNKQSSGNTRGQAFFLFGENYSAFKKEFTKHGSVVKLK